MTAQSIDPRFAWVIGTFDTKRAELEHVATLIRAAGVAARTVDISTSGDGSAAGLQRGADISAAEVAAAHPQGAKAIWQCSDRGQAVQAMGLALQAWMRVQIAAGRAHGVVGLGGSGGTSMLAPAMRLLPIGRPKLLLSTMAAGNVSAYVDVVDMTLMYPVTDFAGLNRLSRAVLANAAHAMAGMLSAPQSAAAASACDKPSLGISMFGVTTPCVQAVRSRLDAAFDCQVFHANGSGGRTLEALAAAGMLAGVVDVTTTEIGQNLAGGTCDAGPDRLDCAARHGLPWVGSVGALDMVNWGPLASVPARHKGRLLHGHNADVTLMRSSPAEMAQAGRRICAKLNAAPGPVCLLLPRRGVSALDAVNGPFHDPAADAALFAAIEREFAVSPSHQLMTLDLHINDPAFANEIADQVFAVMQA